MAIIPLAIICASLSMVLYESAYEYHTHHESERTFDYYGYEFHVYSVPHDFEYLEAYFGDGDYCSIDEYDFWGMPEDKWERDTCWGSGVELYVRDTGSEYEFAFSEQPEEIAYEAENEYITNAVDVFYSLCLLAIPGSLIAYFYLGRMDKQKHERDIRGISWS